MPPLNEQNKFKTKYSQKGNFDKFKRPGLENDF